MVVTLGPEAASHCQNLVGNPPQVHWNIDDPCLVKGGDWGKENIVGSDIVKKVYRVKLRRGC